MKNSIVLSVRELVEFILRSGSIDSRFGGFDRAKEGARIHRKLQKAEKDSYQPEVRLSNTMELDGYVFRVSGRADGIYTEKGETVVDEIKTVTTSLENINEENRPTHWAQAKCYAFFYADQYHLDFINVRLTYYHVESGQIKHIRQNYSRIVLEKFYLDLLKQYVKWAKLKTKWSSMRNERINKMNFPYGTYRHGQREMAVAVYNAIRQEQNLFINAPTGIGKTLSTLFPALKALGEDYIEKIFYLTAKNSTCREAEKNFQLLKNTDYPCRCITLTAKEKICFLEKNACNPEECPYACGYFDRINDSLYQILQSAVFYSREKIEAIAEQYQLCPFELSLDLSEWCELIICDYNYLFDPQAALRRFFDETDKKPYVFLIDEAHNLVERSREMYTAQVCREDYRHLRKELGTRNQQLYKILNRVDDAFSEIVQPDHQGLKSWFHENAYGHLNEQLYYFCYGCEDWIRKHSDHKKRDLVLDLYFKTRSYLKIAEYYDEHYITQVETQKYKTRIQQICLDPSALLKARSSLGRNTVYFSATLTPLAYFVRIFGENTESPKYSLPSPFNPQKLGILLADSIDTRYHERAKSSDQVAAMIAAFIKGKAGNYLVYFPSYQYLKMIYDKIVRMTDIRPVIQKENMDETERLAFMETFNQTETPQTGFCVLGGIYSEGIDLKGERLIGSVIVSVGLPKLTEERNYMRAYYESHSPGTGFAYAYQFPGMNKVLQAAGRVIRDEKDCGMVLFIDRRLGSADYRKLFPEHLAHYIRVNSASDVEKACTDFWKDRKNNADI